jgi:UDP-2,3-diacylglucosamine pyrophosphatase LpxH
MKRKSYHILWVSLAMLMVIYPGMAAAKGTRNKPVGWEGSSRFVAIISDLHWGLGKDRAGVWEPKEDFRWTNALRGFLGAISTEGNEAVDLLVLGDLLELWQPPKSVACRGESADIGCTVEEMQAITRAVIAAHQKDFEVMRDFCQKGSNRILIIAGNHDAALLIPEIWNLVVQALDADGGCVKLIDSGFWQSQDGRVVAEHGHQIGQDVNRYGNWPEITRDIGNRTFIIRPWGERFVQKIFNNEETAYPIIDNLSPEASGIRYRMADRGPIGSAKDIARFLAFNLFETSFQQKVAFLGRPPKPGTDYAEYWVREKALDLDYRLFLLSLDPSDAFTQFLKQETAEAQAVKEELGKIVKTMSDEELQMLCLQAAGRTGVDPCTAQLGALIESMFIPKSKVMRTHLSDRINGYPNMEFFIYGHTHLYEVPWEVQMKDGRYVHVINSGAFQRLVNEEGFKERTRELDRPAAGLREISLEDLAPCYTAVVIQNENDRMVPKLRIWHMPVDKPGQWLSPGSASCR